MMTILDPKTYGLSSRDKLIKISKNHFALVIERKSRIIMTDGRRILEKVKKVLEKTTGVKISLRTNAPVCSKTSAFLREKGIEIRGLD